MKRPDWKHWIDNKTECKSWLDKYIKKKVLRKSKDESKLHLKKSNHDLNIANWIFENHTGQIRETFGNENFYDWVIIIFYYAIYHSALALLSKEGYKSKNHSATLCFLIYNHLHRDKNLMIDDIKAIALSIDKQDIETIGFSKELRERASYVVHETFNEALIENTRKQAIELINKVKNIISE